MNYLITLEIQETQFHYLEDYETTTREESHVIWATTEGEAEAVADALAKELTDREGAPDEPTVATVNEVIPLQGAQT